MKNTSGPSYTNTAEQKHLLLTESVGIEFGQNIPRLQKVAKCVKWKDSSAI